MNIVGVTTKAVKFSTVKKKINNYKNKLENFFFWKKGTIKKRYGNFLLIEENFIRK